MEFKYKTLVPAGTRVSVAVTIKSIIQRQVAFTLMAVDADTGLALIDCGKHVRAYPTHKEMMGRLEPKMKGGTQLKAGVAGWHATVVKAEETGGANDVADQAGAVRNNRPPLR